MPVLFHAFFIALNYWYNYPIGFILAQGQNYTSPNQKIEFNMNSKIDNLMDL